MNGNNRDSNSIDKTGENAFVGDDKVSFGQDIKDIETATGPEDQPADVRCAPSPYITDKKVGEKVEGVLNYESPIDRAIESEEKLLQTNNPEEIVRDWELTNHMRRASGKALSKTARKISVLTASINLYENRGITVRDVRRLGFGKDHAEKLLQDGKKAGLLVASEQKIGKQKQYFMSNYKYVIDKKARENKRQEIFPNDISLLLAHELSNMHYVYHRIGLETSLLHKKDYDLFGGRVLSQKNRQKVGEVRLDSKRTCSITISPNGTVGISIMCSIKPYELHTPSGLVDFFVSCGQILRYLQSDMLNRVSAVPPVSEWYLTQFDYNKDLVVEGLRDRNPSVNWSSQGLLKVKHLGAVFLIYSKDMPGLGECLRMDGHYSTKQKEKMVDTVKRIADKENLPFTTAEDMLRSAKENDKGID